MISFFSSESDFSPNIIFRYLLYKCKKDTVTRYNKEDQIESFVCLIQNSESRIKFKNFTGEKYNSTESTVQFIRRFSLNFGLEIPTFEIDRIEKFSKEEFLELETHFLETTAKSKSFYSNGIKDFAIDKLKQLEAAKMVNIDIPITLITNSKVELKEFMAQNNQVIIKPITNHTGFKVDDSICQATGTQIFNKQDFSELPNYFFPSLFQAFVEKTFEVRTFFFKKKLWSMAIFSQKNTKTKVDFRNYDRTKENRRVPFVLPIAMVKKIEEMIDFLSYNSGSIDLIYNEGKGYTFLEINLSGQFGMVSIPCNYNIEKHIAEDIISCNGEN